MPRDKVVSLTKTIQVDHSQRIEFAHPDAIFIGCDEVGRGALAGPITAGACAFYGKIVHSDIPCIIRDSKKMNRPQRQQATAWIRQQCLAISISSVSPSEIDTYGIQSANKRALARSVQSVIRTLQIHPPHRARLHTNHTDDTNHSDHKNHKTPQIFIISDHFSIESTLDSRLHNLTFLTVDKGEDHSFAVAAASIIAKTHRDTLMIQADQLFPHYGWQTNVGYGTLAHRDALTNHGPTHFHRRSFLRQMWP